MKLKMKTNLVLITLILLFSILVSLPLLKPGLYLIHDDQHIARLYLFDKSLKAGQFPVRWVDGLGFNFGYPLYNFYPPFTYMLGEIFHLASFTYIDSIKLVFFSSIFFSGVAMYIFVKELWGRSAGTISSLFYLLVPYRALDLYVRGALAESFSFVWLPLILWSFLKLFKTGNTRYIYLSAIFLALLMITHNLIFLPFMLILPFYLFFLIWKSLNRKLLVVSCIGSVVLSFLLSAFFWAPALLEKRFTIVDEMLLVNLADFRIHFVYPQQLWNWTWGFGGSAAGLADGISFKIGKLHIISSVFSLAFALIHMVRRNKQFKFTVHSSQFTVLFFLLFIMSAFMTTFYSRLIWETIKPLAYLQFPWRFLTFTALFSSILAGALLYYLKLSILKLTAGSILICILLFFNFNLFKPQEYRFNLTDEIATSSEVINWDVSKTSFEYVPKGVALYKDERGVNMLDINKNDIPQNKLELVSGDANLEIASEKPDEIMFNITVHQDSIIKANIFNFSGWHVLINNRYTPISDNNDLKLITFKVPQGGHEVKVLFKNNNVRTFANMLSLGSLVLLIALMIRQITGRSMRWEVRK